MALIEATDIQPIMYLFRSNKSIILRSRFGLADDVLLKFVVPRPMVRIAMSRITSRGVGGRESPVERPGVSTLLYATPAAAPQSSVERCKGSIPESMFIKPHTFNQLMGV